METAPADSSLEPVAVRVRRMRFDLDAAPRYWHSDSPFLTHHFTAMSLFFPGGERFFIDSVRHFEKDLADPVLRGQVKAFVAQEGQHSHHHRVYDRLMSRSGVPVDRYEGWVDGLLRFMRRWIPAKAQLALTITLEHFTAVFADLLLTDDQITEGMHPKVRELWLWHAVEETEHKAVAFDVYQQVCGSYWLRAFMMARVIIGFPIGILFFHFLLMIGDRKAFGVRDIARGLRIVWGPGGFFPSALRGLLVFFRRDFHPWQKDNRNLIDDWSEQHPAVAS
ncbi:MAG: metal-dependent hydrolase [Deltaproteobacteria bacterium]|nr:metal-dependent hydrolase [Deltaproteobacteria bacterium]MBW2447969.1 metal-dependent hydrolase [Deltaproteobacteria bacterium]